MKLLTSSEFVVVKAGRRYSMPPPVQVHGLLESMERNESYIYWLQPKDGGIHDQFASINVNGKFYHLNSKLEKAIFRNVRLTKDFRNYEYLADGTMKLRIPTRLLREKIRTSVRVVEGHTVRARECGRVWMWRELLHRYLTVSFFTGYGHALGGARASGARASGAGASGASGAGGAGASGAGGAGASEEGTSGAGVGGKWPDAFDASPAVCSPPEAQDPACDGHFRCICCCVQPWTGARAGGLP